MKLSDIKLDSHGRRVFRDVGDTFKKLIKKLSCSKETATIYKNINKLELENTNINKYINNIDSSTIIKQTDPSILLQLERLTEENEKLLNDKNNNLKKIKELMDELDKLKVMAIKNMDLDNYIENINKELKTAFTADELKIFLIDLYKTNDINLLSLINKDVEITTLQNTKKIIEDELIKVNEELEQTLKDKLLLKNKIDELKIDNDILRKEKEFLSNKIKEHEDNIIKLNLNINELSKDEIILKNLELKTENEKLNKANNDLLKVNKQLDNDNKALTDQIIKIEQDVINATSELSIIKSEYEAIKENLKNEKNNKTNLLKEIDNLNKEKEKLIKAVKNLHEENKKMDNLNKVKKMDIENNTKELSEKKAELEKINNEINSKIAEYNNIMEDIAKMKIELNTLKESYNNIKVDISLFLDEYDNKKKYLDDKEKELKLREEALLTNSCKNYNDELYKLQIENRELSNNIKLLHEKMNNMITRIKSINDNANNFIKGM